MASERFFRGFRDYCISVFLLVISAVLPMADARAQDGMQSHFEHTLEQLKAGNFTHSPIESLAGFHIILVTGFANELPDFYFSGTKHAFENLGAAKVTILRPSSYNSADANINHLNREIRELYQVDRIPMIVLGHSKGATEVAGLSFRYPDLATSNMVAAFIAAQGALQGCHLGDIGARISRLFGLSASWLNGLRSLSNDEIRTVIEEPLAQLDRPTRLFLSERTFYLTSHQDWGKTALVGRAAHMMMQMFFSQPSDGFISEHDMEIPNHGRILGRMKIDHFAPWIGKSLLNRFLGITTANDFAVTAMAETLGRQIDRIVMPTINPRLLVVGRGGRVGERRSRPRESAGTANRERRTLHLRTCDAAFKSAAN